MTSERKLYVGLAFESSKEVGAIGLLKLLRRGVVESGQFAYGTNYINLPQAVSLNEGYLSLSDGLFELPERRMRDGGALPLTFRDALPDKWGRLVLQAQHGKHLDDVDVLLMTNADRVGAMVFSEANPIDTGSGDEILMPLEDLSEAVLRVERQMEVPPAMRRLLQRGSSLGGARPKATFLYNNARWIAKFPALGDDHDVELLEASILKLAELCGINVPISRLEQINRGHALLVRRFDREGEVGSERRLHYLSASALLNVPYESNGGSYVELAQFLRRLALNPDHDLEQLFKRMVFNLVIDNTDDHVKNHGALLTGQMRYRLAPAFDMVMQITNTGYQELAIAPGKNNSSIKLAKEVAPQFGIKQADAEHIIQSIYENVDLHLLPLIKQLGGDEVLIRRVEKCLKVQRDIISSQ